MTVRRALVLLAVALALLALAACGGGSSGGDLASGAPSGSPQPAPEFATGQTWFNVAQPLTLHDLRGKVVLLDFWTLGCINCQHTVPDFQRLENEFGDALAVIGVHSGKYDREHDDDSIREAILRLGIDHPVVNDPDFAIWNAYGANAWPTQALIDPEGNYYGSRSGEGVYDALEGPIKKLIADFDGRGEIDRTPIPIDLEAAPIASAFLKFPGAVLADEAGGRLFIADSGNNRILVAGLDGALQSAIGSGVEGWADGPSAQAQFNQPQGLALSLDGNTLYVADTRNHRIRAVDLAAGTVTTIAGTGKRLETLPAPGASPLDVDLASPWGIQPAGGILYIAMAGSHQLWTLDVAANAISVLAGTGAEGIDDGPPLDATFAQPSGITTDGTNLFWVDPESSSVRTLPLAGGNVKTLVGKGLFDFGDVDGPPGTALLEHAQGIAYGNGTLYIADTYNHKIKTVDPASGQAATVAGTGAQGDADGPASTATFDEPGGLSFAGGLLYIADTNNNALRTFNPQTGEVATLQLSNLAVAMGSASGRTLRQSLTAETISPSATTLRIRIRAPEGYHLNSLAPSMLTLSTSNDQAVAPQQSTVSWSTDDPSVEVTAPVTVAAGQAIVSAAGDVYYCKQGEDALCLIDRIDIALPLTVADGAADTEAVLDYELPQ
ncbi:MAG TPA: redoxin domain-containing protein [Dehalococcoidia bacterium]|nr:redoxin domain-containing protein [Dehalococcoidia bacterium]